LLAAEIRKSTKVARVRADTLGYLQRSFVGVVSDVDAKEARIVGKVAVKEAVAGHASGSIAIKRKPGKKYLTTFKRVPLKNVAKETRHMPDKFINQEGNDVTAAFLAYAKPIVGPLPKIGRFKGYPVKKAK